MTLRPFSALGLLLFPSVAFATDFKVGVSADSVDGRLGDCICSDTSGDCSLRAAVMEANACAGNDNIYVPADTYTLTLVTGTTTGSFGPLYVDSEMTIKGEVAGSVIVTAAGISDRHITVSSAGDLTVDNLWLINGDTAGFGGSLLNSGSTRVVDTVFYSNQSQFDGGAVANMGDLTVEDSLIYLARSQASGGGLYSTGTLSMSDSQVMWTDAPSSGGGVYAAGTATLHGVDISGCRAASGAGLGAAGDVTLTDSTISSNRATYAGGGIMASGNLDMVGSTVRDNQAAFWGAGVHLTLGSGHVLHSIQTSAITGNEAPQGGGIYAYSGTVDIQDSSISRNTAHTSQGGGLLVQGTVTGVNLSLAENRAATTGGGIRVASTGSLDLANSLVADNQGTTGADCAGTVDLSGPNLLGSTAGCTTTGISPSTGAAGLGAFVASSTPGGAHHPLGATSQAVDGGDASLCNPTDQLGNGRSGVCDLGAVEF